MYHQYRKESNEKVRKTSVSKNTKARLCSSSNQGGLKTSEKRLFKIWDKTMAKLNAKESIS